MFSSLSIFTAMTLELFELFFVDRQMRGGPVNSDNIIYLKNLETLQGEGIMNHLAYVVIRTMYRVKSTKFAITRAATLQNTVNRGVSCTNGFQKHISMDLMTMTETEKRWDPLEMTRRIKLILIPCLTSFSSRLLQQWVCRLNTRTS